MDTTTPVDTSLPVCWRRMLESIEIYSIVPETKNVTKKVMTTDSNFIYVSVVSVDLLLYYSFSRFLLCLLSPKRCQPIDERYFIFSFGFIIRLHTLLQLMLDFTTFCFIFFKHFASVNFHPQFSFIGCIDNMIDTTFSALKDFE